MSKELKLGTLVKVITDNDDVNRYAIVINHDGTPDYPNDYWVEFTDGARRPYGDYELETITIEYLQSEIEKLEELKKKASSK